MDLVGQKCNNDNMNDVLSFLEQLIFVLDVNVDVTKNDSENGNDHISIENGKNKEYHHKLLMATTKHCQDSCSTTS